MMMMMTTTQLVVASTYVAWNLAHILTLRERFLDKEKGPPTPLCPCIRHCSRSCVGEMFPFPPSVGYIQSVECRHFSYLPL